MKSPLKSLYRRSADGLRYSMLLVMSLILTLVGTPESSFASSEIGPGSELLLVEGFEVGNGGDPLRFQFIRALKLSRQILGSALREPLANLDFSKASWWHSYGGRALKTLHKSSYTWDYQNLSAENCLSLTQGFVWNFHLNACRQKNVKLLILVQNILKTLFQTLDATLDESLAQEMANDYALAVFERLEPPQGPSWSLIAGPADFSPRQNYALAYSTNRDQILFWGGQTSTSSALNTGYLFDIPSQVWTPTSLENAPRPNANYTAVAADQLWVLASGQFADSVMVYDGANREWSEIASPSPLYGKTLQSFWNGREVILWLAETSDEEESITYRNRGVLFDPNQVTFQQISFVGQPDTQDPEIAVTKDGLLVFGGKIREPGQKQEQLLPQSEIYRAWHYQQASDRWQDFPLPQTKKRPIDMQIAVQGEDILLLLTSLGGSPATVYVNEMFHGNLKSRSWRSVPLPSEFRHGEGKGLVNWRDELIAIWGGTRIPKVWTSAGMSFESSIRQGWFYDPKIDEWKEWDTNQLNALGQVFPKVFGTEEELISISHPQQEYLPLIYVYRP